MRIEALVNNVRTKIKEFHQDENWKRKLVGYPAKKAVTVLHEVAPFVTADQLSYSGSLLLGIGLGLKVIKDDEQFANTPLSSSVPSTLTLVGSQLLDWIDGAYAKHVESLNPGSVDFKHGQKVDGANDRIQEGLIAGSLMAKAHKEGDEIDEALALVAGVTNPLPSTTRAIAQLRGHKVSETGNNLIQFFGTRTGRYFLGILATINPKIGKIPIRRIATGFIILGNVSNTLSRAKVALQQVDYGQFSEEDRKFREEGLDRAKLYLTASAVTLTGLVSEYNYLNKD